MSRITKQGKAVKWQRQPLRQQRVEEIDYVR